MASLKGPAAAAAVVAVVNALESIDIMINVQKLTSESCVWVHVENYT